MTGLQGEQPEGSATYPFIFRMRRRGGFFLCAFVCLGGGATLVEFCTLIPSHSVWLNDIFFFYLLEPDDDFPLDS